MKYVLTFQSTHAVLKAEKLMKNNTFVCEIVPTPRRVSSDCGMAIRVDEGMGESVKALLIAHGVNAELHRIEA